MTEALRLADALDSDLSAEWMHGITLKHISNELRRLHEVNAELVEALDGLVTAVNAAGYSVELHRELGRADFAMLNAIGETSLQRLKLAKAMEH